MARFIITTKRSYNSNGIRIEPGMRVEVVTQSISSPLLDEKGKQAIVDAFTRIYGIDIKKAGFLNSSALDAKRM